MSYRETLLFVAKCLTISSEEENYNMVVQKIKSQNIDWDEVVKVSTAHYVFPALYNNLQRKHLLEYLPSDLVDYMKHIRDLNAERNEQILQEATQIHHLLQEQHIQPIFLKGAAFLLQGFYEDMAERMIGDIDFIVSPQEYEQAVKILKENGYYNPPSKLDSLKLGKHYPRLLHKDLTAAVEVHYRILKPPHDAAFNYHSIKNNVVTTKDGFFVLSDADQVLHISYNKQANDLGYWHKTISLRNSYDLFLLSKKTNTLEALASQKKYFNLLNTFLASSSYVFQTSSSITYKENAITTAYLKKVILYLDAPQKMKSNKKKWSHYFNSKTRWKKFRLAFVNKEVRSHLLDLLLKR
jgi:hypothetical protein